MNIHGVEVFAEKGIPRQSLKGIIEALKREKLLIMSGPKLEEHEMGFSFEFPWPKSVPVEDEETGETYIAIVSNCGLDSPPWKTIMDAATDRIVGM